MRIRLVNISEELELQLGEELGTCNKDGEHDGGVNSEDGWENMGDCGQDLSTVDWCLHDLVCGASVRLCSFYYGEHQYMRSVIWFSQLKMRYHGLRWVRAHNGVGVCSRWSHRVYVLETSLNSQWSRDMTVTVNLVLVVEVSAVI